MALCGITQGFNFDCLSLRRLSGVNRVWGFNVQDLSSPIDPNGVGVVTGLQFNGYDGLYEFESKKFSHQFTHTLVVAESGAVSWTQEGVLRLFVDTAAEVEAFNNLAVASVGFIVLTNNGEFRIYGASNGLTASAATGTTGRAQGEDTTDSITMTGTEKSQYRILLKNNSYAETLALIEALEF
jgi:hypothetical protein